MQRILSAFVLVCLAGHVAIAQRACVTHEYLQQELRTDALLAKRLSDIESSINNHTHPEYLSSITSGSGAGLPVIVIPVVVHVLYNSPIQNISDAQIQSQIDALNRDFRKLNADTVNTPAAFKHLAADSRIEFKLATVDPRGRATSGILRKATGIQYFGLDDRIKSSAIGGDDPWDANSYLNIWIGNMAGGLLGYANPLGGAKEKDGVVLHYIAVGTMGTVSSTYNKGRTATHEVGHWLGLRHIWGDEYCGNDFVDDTPPQRSPSFKCPTGVIVTCNNDPHGNMYMNFMDMTYDACVNLFTAGQAERMRSQFAVGGFRHALLSSKGLGVPLPEPVVLPEDSIIAEPAAVVRLFPNPVTSMLTIDVSNDEQLIGKTISFYTPQGQLITHARITKSIMQVYLMNLKQGMYIMRIEGRKDAWKVIKQ